MNTLYTKGIKTERLNGYYTNRLENITLSAARDAFRENGAKAPIPLY